MLLIADRVKGSLLLLTMTFCALGQTAPGSRIDLAKGWNIQSSAKATETGAVISTGEFQPGGWYPAAVPTTVIADLVANGYYANPYYSKNLALIPGTPTGRGQNVPTPADSPFAVPWWYRTEFKLPAAVKGERLWLNFDAINYKANIWLNGHQIASADKVIGMYRMWEFDITESPWREDQHAGSGGDPAGQSQNRFHDHVRRLEPHARRQGYGPGARRLYPDERRRNGAEHAGGDASGRSADKAHLTIYADLKNATDQPVEGTLKGAFGSVSVTKQVKLAPNEARQIAFTPEENPSLNIADPKLWWPYGLGPQNLNTLHMEFVTGGAVSDREDVEFGMREVTGVNDAQKHRQFTINGKKILIRGGGWSPDMMMRYDNEREVNEITYARDMNLNTIRLEGKMMNEHFFDTTDKLGMLVMPGWCCCSYWERGRLEARGLHDRGRIAAGPDPAHPQSSERVTCGYTAATIRRATKPRKSI